ncbi:larval cuticle protein A2B-like [Penaeus japonicus]|uniref:larval cuticle protein A2B-like n=1 Tax=Penaeus japonicus TaxID=27405 RepID=UPI001C70F7EA|nr:larval cuticle protein A2B-like [Penaeus japonicus]
MSVKVLVFLGLVALAAADKLPTYSYNAPQAQESSEYSDEAEPPKYDFAFGVKDGYSGADFAHEEARDEDETRGSYSVQLPDGRLQKVTYYVDGDNGYVADVTYEGEARYDSVESREYAAPRPVYSAPRPVYSAPESHESVEAPVYSPPRPQYAAPRRSYGFPQ